MQTILSHAIAGIHLLSILEYPRHFRTPNTSYKRIPDILDKYT